MPFQPFLKQPAALKLLVVLFALSCSKQKSNEKAHAGFIPDSTRFYAYLKKGDSIYATKKGYEVFEQSMKYFDSAQQLAETLNNELFVAEATFAKGRVYDAWNKEPAKTIELFDKAAELFKSFPEKYTRYMYVRHLVAHGYDKIKDSSNCVRVLSEMYNEILPLNNLVKRRMPYIAEMALISTEVKNYTLAQKILNLLDEKTIQNDPDTYDYRNHYFITQSRLDVYYRKSGKYPYLDSLTKAFNRSANVFDSMYYSEQLYQLYKYLKRYDRANEYLDMNRDLMLAVNNREGLSNMQTKLLTMELESVEKQRSLEKQNYQTRAEALWVLSTLLLVITIMTFIISKRNRLYKVQQKKLLQANKELDEKNEQNILLNKEIHHRIKNNMQMIIGLLNMQERKTDNPEVIDHLQNAKLRIESISALYERFVDGNVQNIDFTTYIPELINNIVACVDTNKNTVTHLNIKSVCLSNSQCHALSLILNEWVTNSIKYAECENDMLQLFINIENETEETICVEYRDNGTSRPTNKISEGLGTQIIQLLSQQLKGRFVNDTDNRFSYKLIIPNGV